MSIFIFEIALTVGLKHYPHEIGFLFHKDDLGESAFTEACKRCGEDAWDTALGCLEETDPKKVLERNPRTNVYPFMVAAADDSVGCLDVVYYLLRKDPVVLKCAAYIPGDDVTKKREREWFRISYGVCFGGDAIEKDNGNIVSCDTITETRQ